MLKPDYSWKALTCPGEAYDYFNFSFPAPITSGAELFDLNNACFLAELSRLMYHPQFFNDDNIQLNTFEYETVGYIEEKSTSTHVALLKVIQDEPCLVIAFRGSDEIEDWNINFHAYQTSYKNKGKTHSGFMKAYLSIRDKLDNYLTENTLPFFITGHSLGAALAILAMSDFYENKNFDSCYTFGSPRIGNQEFSDSIICERVYRIVNNCDVVTSVPIDFAEIEYKHIGTPYLVNEQGELIDGMSEDEIYAYQKSKLPSLKEYAVSKIFNTESKSIKDDLPSYLADHAPINYVLSLQNNLERN